MTRKSDAVYVCYADRRAVPETAIAALVTAEDRQRLTPTMHERRRTEYLAGRALLRHALGGFTQRDGASFRVEVTAQGKPRCVGGPAVSLSHSGHWLVCALANSHSVGIDVETTQLPRSEPNELAARFFTPAEARWVAAEPATRFLMLWVLKEAYLKALGVGLSGGLTALECSIEPPRIAARSADGSECQLVLLEGPDCYIGVASLDTAKRLEVELEPFAPPGGEALEPLRVAARTD